ncbi:glycogen synthase [Actinobacillus pleuropneumoniae]|nr:glycogen synthase [Actinobacillus pleuropneumoniae]
MKRVVVIRNKSVFTSAYNEALSHQIIAGGDVILVAEPF